MAVVEYSCSACGLRIEKFFRSNVPETLECDSCGEQAKRCISDFGFVFDNGKTPGNSGVDSLDRDYDKYIGRDSKKRWEYVKDRNSRKRKVQRDHGGEEKVPLRMNSQGEYEPMQQKDVKKFQRLHKLGSDAIQHGKKESSDS